MTSETELQQAIDKTFIHTCLNYGKFNLSYSLETIEVLEQSAYRLTQFARALRLKLAEKLDTADGELES